MTIRTSIILFFIGFNAISLFVGYNLSKDKIEALEQEKQVLQTKVDTLKNERIRHINFYYKGVIATIEAFHSGKNDKFKKDYINNEFKKLVDGK